MTDAATFDDDVLEQLDAILDLVNTGFADTLAFVARWIEADDAIEVAQLLSLDPRGADAEVTTAEGTRPARFDFETPMAGLHDLETAMLGLVDQARAARPTEPLTDVERRLAETDRQRTYRTTILATEELSPRLRAFTVGPLDGWDDLGGDQSLTLFLDLPGRPVPEVVRISELREMDDDVRPKGATYSVRRHDPTTGTIEIWVVLHGDDPHTVGGWAADAAVGDPITVWGPRRARQTVVATDRFVGVCDETGLAATLATLDEMPDDVAVDLIVEVDDESHEFSISSRSDVTLHWCHRGDHAPGSGTALVDRTREVLGTPSDGTVIFGAGESRCVTAVRRLARQELEMPAQRVALTGYWRAPKR